MILGLQKQAASQNKEVANVILRKESVAKALHFSSVNFVFNVAIDKDGADFVDAEEG